MPEPAKSLLAVGCGGHSRTVKPPQRIPEDGRDATQRYHRYDTRRDATRYTHTTDPTHNKRERKRLVDGTSTIPVTARVPPGDGASGGGWARSTRVRGHVCRSYFLPEPHDLECGQRGEDVVGERPTDDFPARMPTRTRHHAGVAASDATQRAAPCGRGSLAGHVSARRLTRLSAWSLQTVRNWFNAYSNVPSARRDRRSASRRLWSSSDIGSTFAGQLPHERPLS